MTSRIRLLASALVLPVLASFSHAQGVIVVGSPSAPATTLVIRIQQPAATFKAGADDGAGGLLGARRQMKVEIQRIGAQAKELRDAEGLKKKSKRTKGAQKSVAPAASPYTDAEIVAMAEQLAKQYKGSPWSYTEYNSVLYPTLDHLRQQGVPERQIALFQKTCEDYPGRPFNPWSGD